MNKKILILGIALFLLLLGCTSKEPTNASATPVMGGVQLTWSAVQDAAGYNIYRSTAVGTPGQKINANQLKGQTSYMDTSVSDSITYYYTVKSIDASGTEYGQAQVSAKAKVLPPQSLKVGLGDGSNFTTTRSVTLALYSIGASECRLSNDGNTWSDWSPYTIETSWILPPSDGQKDVYYQCRDDLGNTAPYVFTTLYLDTTPPKIVLTSPVSGTQYASSFDVVFKAVDPNSDTLACTAKLDNGQAIALGPVDSGTQYNISVSAPSGARTLSMECRDFAQKASAAVSFTIVNQPAMSFTIADGSGYVDRSAVTLSVTSNSASDCRFSNDGTSWSDWSLYKQQASWQLSPGDGTKNIFGQCRNANSVVSNTAEDSVIVDTHPPPYISLTINNGDSWTNSNSVYLGMYAFAAARCRFSNDGNSWADWELYKTGKPWTLSSGDGLKSVYFNCIRADGFDLGTASSSIRVSKSEPNPPTELSITINNGDSYTSSRYVTFTLFARNAYECKYREGYSSWSAWEDYTTSRDFTLSSGDGAKVIYYDCRNDYGEAATHDSIYLDTQPPYPINDLIGQSRAQSDYLQWSPAHDQGSGVIKYKIYRSAQSLGLFTQIGSTTATTYLDSSLKQGETYAYYVTVVDHSGQESDKSNVVDVTIGGLLLGGTN